MVNGGRDGEVRFYGEIGSDSCSVRRFVRKLERPGARLRFCYEAGPTRYGLERLIEALGHSYAAAPLTAGVVGVSGSCGYPARCNEDAT